MTVRGRLQIALGVVMWTLVIVAAWRGMWIPLAVLLGFLAVVGLLVFAPIVAAQRRRDAERRGRQSDGE